MAIGFPQEHLSPDRLWEEYKLIQEKIDKIGDFQFKVKGWSLTLLGGVLYGGARTSQFTVALLGGLIIGFVFNLLEQRQLSLSHRLGRRILDIERAFQLFPPIENSRLWNAVVSKVPSLRYAPGVGRTLARSQTGFGAWVLSKNNQIFYAVQYVLLSLLLVVHLTGFSLRRIGEPIDPKPRYEVSVCGYRIIIYREESQH